MNKQLAALTLAGIRPDSLGSYLVGLGLLSALAAKWPEVRACWRNGCFALLEESLTREQVESYLLEEWRSTAYARWWGEKQKADTKAKADKNLWKARSAESVVNARLLDAHIVGVGRNQFNPVLGTGGNIGKRDLAKVYENAKALVASSEQTAIVGWLRATLYADFDAPLPDLTSAGTWFVYANKTFNSGQGWYREGQISPWSFLLALEGALLLVGGAAKRLSANARSYAVFPFITDTPAPLSENEVGLFKAEFWAPLWKQPTSLPELRALLERGLTRIGQRTAKAPYEFAVAARSAGVDAGVEEFVRFVLRSTTSSQVYEAVPGERIKVGTADSADSELIQQIIPWLDRLPYEPRDSKQKGKFKGLRGPLEQAIIRIAERADDAERWQHLLLLLAETQGRIDRNKSLRDRCRALGWLAEGWFNAAWPSPPPEIQLARAVASLGAGGEMPLAVNVFGIELDKSRTPIFSGDKRPQRTIWHHGDLLRLLTDVLERRLVDTDAAQPLPLDAPARCPLAAVEAFLADSLDFELIGCWIPPLSLIKWTQPLTAVGATCATQAHGTDGTMLLHSLFRSLFYPHKLEVSGKELFPDHLRPSAALARRLLNLIRQGELAEAVQLAQNRYLAAGRAIVLPPVDLSAAHERIAAALIIPMHRRDVVSGLARWLQPSKHNLKGRDQ
jgi:CRISPR-associated protein Csx17